MRERLKVKNTCRLIEEFDLDGVTKWFGQLDGTTDVKYLNAHFDRFMKTKQFALGDQKPSTPLNILDVGCHWLHNAFFYAHDGHKLFCIDVSSTLKMSNVVGAAELMNADLIISRNLELGEGIANLPESSIDLVLFCEIIEHLTFNPIPMWKEIYRVLKPGGRIILTTPNANYWEKLHSRLARLLQGKGWGIEVENILASGTFGHHWKEYTVGELRWYFSSLSPDFSISKVDLVNLYLNRPPPLEWKKKVAIGNELRFDNILMEISLSKKEQGIALSPPWIPDYS